MDRRLLAAVALLGGLAGLLPITVQAGTREDVEAASARCAGLVADRAWLDCYYGAAQPMRAQLGLPAAAAAQVRLVPPARAAMAPAGKGGWFSGLLGEGGHDNCVHLATYTFDRHGLFTAALSNGEVWQQAADDVNIAHWRKPAASYTVRVAAGAFGSANLEVENDGAVYRVQRIK